MNKFINNLKKEKHAIIIYLLKILIVGASILFIEAIISKVSIEGYGEFTLLVAYMAITASLILYNAQPLIQRNIARTGIFNTQSRFFFIKTVCIQLITSFLIFTVVIGCYYLNNFELNYNLTLIMLAVALVLVRSWYAIVEDFFSALGMKKKLIIIYGTQILASVISSVMLFNSEKASLVEVFLLAILPYLMCLSVGVYFILVITECSADRLNMSKSALVRMHFVRAIKRLNQDVDSLIVGSVLGVSMLGSYDVLKRYFSPLAMFSAPFSQILFKSIQSRFINKDYNKLAEVFLISIFVALFSGVLIIIVMSVVSSADMEINIIDVFKNSDLLLVIIVMIVGALKSSMWWSRTISFLIDSKKLLKMSFTVAIIGSVTMIVLAIPLGIYGVLIGNGLALVMTIAWWLYQLKRVGNETVNR